MISFGAKKNLQKQETWKAEVKKSSILRSQLEKMIE